MHIPNEIKATTRFLLRRPAWMLAATTALAIGVGSVAVLAGLLDAVLTRPLGVRNGERLFTVYWVTPGQGGADDYGTLSYPTFRKLRDLLAPDDLAAFCRTFVVVGAGDRPFRAVGELVAPEYFDVLGVEMALGRALATDTEIRETTRQVVLSYDFWRGRFSARSDIVGSEIALNGIPYTVLGVVERGFNGVAAWRAEFWAPLAAQPDLVPTPGFDLLAAESAPWLQVVGLRNNGVHEGIVQARATGAQERLAAAAFPAAETEAVPQRAMRVLPGNYLKVWPEYRRQLTEYIGRIGLVAALLLLASCANVGMLLLARDSERRAELNIRRALGARGRDFVRRAAVEVAIVSLGGLSLACGVAYIGTRLLALLPLPVPTEVHLAPDLRLLAMLAALTVVTGIGFGIVPVLRSTRNLVAGPAASRSPARGLNLLMIGQVGVSCALLFVAGLLLRSASTVAAVDPGFRARTGLFATLVTAGGLTPAQYEAIAESVERVAGVESAALTWHLPLGRIRSSTNFTVPGGHIGPNDTTTARYNVVSAPYFSSLDIAILNGRVFRSSDTTNGQPVAVVGESFARQHLGGDAIGALVRFDLDGVTRRVVGVVSDLKYNSLLEPPVPFVYLPASQAPRSGMALAIRTDGRATADLIEHVRGAVFEVAPDSPPVDIVTFREQITQASSRWRAAAAIAGVGAVLAMVLAAIGVYGATSYWCALRERDMGVRVALGATTSDLLAIATTRAVKFGALGILIGLIGGIWIAGLASTLLVATPAFEPRIALAAASAVLLVHIVAAAIPTLRVARRDPSEVLRH